MILQFVMAYGAQLDSPGSKALEELREVLGQVGALSTRLHQLPTIIDPQRDQQTH